MDNKERRTNVQRCGSSDTASPAASIADHVRWAAVLARDPAADADFVYAVKTTGVYCRPSSSARLPKRENVVFFGTAREAEAAGYRPSRRRAGDRTASAARRAALVAEACRLLESVETELSLTNLRTRPG
jgi:AraC family transcriptional regulator of adaptative response/methylated-DNA-[protein]-cysteine methyltransferase